jgi:SAM-dependent methyltransferase
VRAEEYELMYCMEDSLWWYRGMQAITRAVLERCYRPGSGLRIADLGCGTGATTAFLARYGTVTGVDVEQLALRLARQRGLARLARASVTCLPLPAASFDLVTCFDVLVMLERAAEACALAEIARVLKPGGRLLVRVAAHDWLRGAHDRAWAVQHRYDARELGARLAGAGLRPEHVSHANLWLFPVAAAKRLAEQWLVPTSDRSDLAYNFGGANGLLARVLASEAGLVAGPGLPLGLSLYALARKPV